MKRLYSKGLDALACAHKTEIGRFIPGIVHGEALGAVTRRNRERRAGHDDGDDMIGTIDIGAKQLQMNNLRTVPLSVARELLKGGQQAIDRAKSLATDFDLPGGTARDNVFWKLQWHDDNLAKQAGSNSTLYPSGDDLKKWVMEAFIEANAAEEGAKQQALAFGQIWTDMWTNVTDALAALPQAVAQVAVATAQTLKEAASGVKSTVIWTEAIVIGGAVLLGGGILYALYKVLVSDTGKAVATSYLGRRF